MTRSLRCDTNDRLARYIAVVQYSRYDSAAKSYMVDGMTIFYSNSILKRADSLRFQPVDPNRLAGVNSDDRQSSYIFLDTTSQEPEVLHGVRRA